MNHIKKAPVEYLDRIIRLRLDIFKDYGKIRDDAEYESMFKQNYAYFYERIASHKADFYLIETNHEIISIAAVIIIEKPPINNDNVGEEGYIFNVYTQPQYRGHGLAAMIIKRIIEDCKGRGIRKISLEANERSKELYARIGFQLNELYMEYRM